MTDQQRLRQCKNFVLGQEAVFVFVVQVKKPFDILHEIVEHHAVQTRDQILQNSIELRVNETRKGNVYLEGERPPKCGIPEEE